MASTTLPQPGTRSERAARTRDRVLEVATELMARRGYSGTTISAISKAAGVMPASIYWHFESKEGLLGAVIERASEAWFDDAADAMAADRAVPPGSPQGRAGLRYIFEERPDFYRVLLLIGMERRHEGGAPLEAVARVRSRLREKLAERLSQRIEVADPVRRQRLAERAAGFATVLLDGTFVAQQLAPVTGEALEARYEQLANGMGVVLDALLAEADGNGGEAS